MTFTISFESATFFSTLSRFPPEKEPDNVIIAGNSFVTMELLIADLDTNCEVVRMREPHAPAAAPESAEDNVPVTLII
jgi:hypothetical protein